jgi:plasmid maintenance system antidote protein VapI
MLAGFNHRAPDQQDSTRKRGVTPDTVWRFAQAFGDTPEFWLSLQAAYDLAHCKLERTVSQL